MRLDIRNIIRFTLVVTTVAYLLDAGVEASKNRKKKNRNRSKRTHGDKPHRHKKYPKEEMGGRVTEPNVRRSAILVEKQRKHKRVHTASWVRNEEYEAGDSESRFNLYMPHTRGGFSPDVYEKILKEKQQMMFQQNDETTMLPVVEAMLEFYVKPTRNEKFYSPSTTTTTNAISSAEPGLSPPFRTTYGRYGLHTLADKTVFGKVIHISDAGRTNSHFGCGEAIANLYEIPENQEPWIALIERGHCSFFIKIKLAERNNASAVIFYDNKDREVPRINTIGTRIVSVIMKKHDGHHVAKVIDGSATVMARIEVRTDPTPDPASNLQSARESTTRGGSKTHHRTSIMTIMISTLLVVIYYRAVTS